MCRGLLFTTAVQFSRTPAAKRGVGGRTSAEDWGSVWERLQGNLLSTKDVQGSPLDTARTRNPIHLQLTGNTFLFGCLSSSSQTKGGKPYSVRRPPPLCHFHESRFGIVIGCGRRSSAPKSVRGDRHRWGIAGSCVGATELHFTPLVPMSRPGNLIWTASPRTAASRHTTNEPIVSQLQRHRPFSGASHAAPTDSGGECKTHSPPLPDLTGAPLQAMGPQRPLGPSRPPRPPGPTPPHADAEDSLLKRQTHAYTRKYQPAYSLSLDAAPPPPPPAPKEGPPGGLHSEGH